MLSVFFALVDVYDRVEGMKKYVGVFRFRPQKFHVVSCFIRISGGGGLIESPLLSVDCFSFCRYPHFVCVL